MFVPGISVTAAVQLVQPFPVTALLQPALFSEQNTLATATLSVAVPVTVKTALLHRWPEVGEVIVSTGGFVSPTLTCNINACVAVLLVTSVTCTVKLKVPLVVGVPDMTPLVDKFIPGGNAPELFVQL